MFKNYLKIAFRNLFKHKAFSCINLAGLAIGMAACLFIFTYVQQETGYDRFWEHADRIYRVRYDQYQNETLQFQSARTFSGLGPTIREDIPEVENAVRLDKDVVTAYTMESQVKDIQMYWTDSTFFKVFQRRFIYGSASNPFPDIHAAVVSRSIAKILFGDGDPQGMRFKLNEGWEFHVSGVFEDLPRSTHMPMDMLIGYPSLFYYMSNFDNATGQLTDRFPDAYRGPSASSADSWQFNNSYTYLLLKKGVSAAELEVKLPAFVKKYTQHLTARGIRCIHHLQAIDSIHLDSHLDREITVNGDKKMVVALSIIAVIILCIAWINFVNLTMVRAIERARETGLRKVVGARRFEIFQQFMLESFLMNGISALIAFVLVAIVRNILTPMLGIPISHSSNPMRFSLFFGFLFLAGTLIAGFYPAFILSSFHPMALYKKQIKTSRQGFDLRKVLVILQFTASIILLAGTLIIYRQLQFMRTQDMGVNINQTLVTYSPMNMIKKPDLMQRLLTYKSEIKNIPGVQSITTSSFIPSREISSHSENVRRTDVESPLHHSYSVYNVDHDFVNTYGLTVLAGQDFIDDPNANDQTVLINETAMKRLGFGSPLDAVNQYLRVDQREFRIRGVVHDHHQESLRKAIDPVIYFYGYVWPYDVGYYSIKMNSKNIQQTVSQIETVWKRTYPSDHFDFFFVDDAFNALYQSDRQFGNALGIFSMLAIFIACLGLFGLIAYTAERRTKEIGIRKALGASIFQMVRLLSKEIAWCLLIANVLAWPVALFAMRKWLQNFAYRIDMTIWPFLLAGVLVFVIALVTASWQAVKAARANPVEVLRYE